MRAVCSLTDPFCNASIGTRWPDFSASPTVPLHVDTIYTITTNASGTAAVTFTPNFPYGILTASVAGTTATCNGTITEYDGNLTTFFNANVGQYRVVNYGLEVIPMVATMTNQGYYVLGETVGNRALNSTFTTPSLFYPNVFVGSLCGDKAAFISRPQGTEASNFGGPTTAATAAVVWSACTVTVSGAQPTSTVLIVRIRANLEYEASNGNLYGQTAKSSKSNVPLMDVVSRVRERIEPLVKGGAEVVEKKVMAYAHDAISRFVGGAIGGFFGGPGGAAAGAAIAGRANHMIMDVD